MSADQMMNDYERRPLPAKAVRVDAGNLDELAAAYDGRALSSTGGRLLAIGELRLRQGDWLVRYPGGELMPMTPDDFNRLFAPAPAQKQTKAKAKAKAKAK